MALAYNTRRLTADVDGVVEPNAKVHEAARRVAALHDDVPEDWLNDPPQRSEIPGGGRTFE